MNHPVALDHTPRFAERGLHDKLIQRRPLQLCCLLEGVLHGLRHPGRNPASFFGGESHLFGYSLVSLWAWSVGSRVAYLRFRRGIPPRRID